MDRALSLALKAKGKTSPNPLVGAVIVKAGKVIGEGYHKQAGKEHAEIIALKKAKSLAKGATLYVNLEPCCHTGRTGPCTDAVIKAGIKKVVIAMRDPNPLVAGKGVAKLKKAGITVMEGLLYKEAKALNAPFEKFITQKLPFVTLKAAVSLDGKIAALSGDSKWISNEASRAKVHEMREESDAILVGLNTVLKDDPSLNVRPMKKGTKHPLRVVVDTKLNTPAGAKLFHSKGGKVVIFCGNDAPKAKEKALADKGAEVVRTATRDKRVNLEAIMKNLASRDIVSLMAEGGGTLYTELLGKGMVDNVAIFVAPIILGGTERYSLMQNGCAKNIKDALKLINLSYRQYGENILIEGKVLK